MLYFISFIRMPNLQNPQRFSEHICRIKMDDEKLDYWRYTDKFEVRKYVSQAIGEEYLNPKLGIYKSFDQIEFNQLPCSFALKATHGSSYNIIVPEKTKLNTEGARKKFEKWLARNFYYEDREKNYKCINYLVILLFSINQMIPLFLARFVKHNFHSILSFDFILDYFYF